jgi:glucan-binding YG repeat protein
MGRRRYILPKLLWLWALLPKKCACEEASIRRNVLLVQYCRSERSTECYVAISVQEELYETKRNQTQPNAAKRYQTLPNATKRYQTKPNETNRNQTLPNVTKRYQTKPNETKPNVTKTLLLEVSQLYYWDQDTFQQCNFTDIMYNMLRDVDPSVVANCIHVLNEVMAKSLNGGMAINRAIMLHLLNRIH